MLSPKLCWLAFGATSAAILFSMLLMGLKDRTALEFVLVDGGIVESSPALIFLLASVSSGLIVLKTKKLLPWAFFAVFCFFLAGEEAEWGRDGILGWESSRSTEEESQPADLHNWLTKVVAELVPNH